jgi:hypothetical protein
VVAGVVVKLAVLGAQVVQVEAEPVEQGLARKDLQELRLLLTQEAVVVVVEVAVHHLPDQIPAALEVLE